MHERSLVRAVLKQVEQLMVEHGCQRVATVRLSIGEFSGVEPALMVAREELAFEPPPTSDSGPLVDAVEALRSADLPVCSLRDATRGGLAAVLHEWADASDKTVLVQEESLPVSDEVRGVCELLGLDPIHVANEGTMVVAVEAGFADATLHALAAVAGCTQAAVIGKVRARGLAPVVVERLAGSVVPLDEPVGAPLPRIC